MQEYPDGDYAQGQANYHRLPTHTNLHLHGMWMYGGKFLGGFVLSSTVAPCRVQDTGVKLYSVHHWVGAADCRACEQNHHAYAGVPSLTANPIPYIGMGDNVYIDVSTLCTIPRRGR